MHNDTAMPIIEFGEGTDYDALYSLLLHANRGLAGWSTSFAGAGEGITYDFVLSDGRTITGTYFSSEGDELTIAVHEDGGPTGKTVTIATDLIEKVVYL